MISVIVITHGTFGQELLRTAQDIVGKQDYVEGLSVASQMGVDHVMKAVKDVLERLKTPEGYLICVDMMGGTPSNTALLSTKDMLCEVVTGVNLYMLISAFSNRPKMDLKTLAAKVAEDGRRAIILPKELLAKRLG
jgi:mannose PTS system EIIA component